MRLIGILLLQLFLLQPLASQNRLPVPLDIQKAYVAGTRSFDGKPGKNYWQNHAHYRIKVLLDPATKTISGSERISYTNNSPDTLKNLVLRLYQDFYRKGAPRDFPIPASDLHDGVKISRLVVDGLDIDPARVQRAGTNMIVPVQSGVKSGETTELEISWSYPVSQNSRVREGYYADKNSFFIGYWYPQVAVYDDIWDWNMFSFTGMPEFYNDFNDYEVEISMPKGYVVWATGSLQNPEANFSEIILQKYLAALHSEEIVHVIDKTDYQKGLATVDRDTLTWIYKAENVTDFSFAASDRYLWDACILQLDKHDVLVSAAYHEGSGDFYEVADISRKALEYFSREMPGVDYPYPAMTVFNGQGGMEFPMMVNDGTTHQRWETVHLTSHEIAHSYFPFYMGINEQQFAFMDEGWAVMLPFELQSRLAPGYDPVARTAGFYGEAGGRTYESSLMLPSVVLSGNAYNPTYRNAAYNKPGLAYYFLKDALGVKVFKKALHEYIKRWNGKHPLPYDFFFTFNEVAGEDLSWFWDPWFFETRYPDLSIESIRKEKNSQMVIIQNPGRMPLPVSLQIVYKDGTSETIRESAGIWRNSGSSVSISLPVKEIATVILGGPQIPDVFSGNNHWPR